MPYNIYSFVTQNDSLCCSAYISLYVQGLFIIFIFTMSLGSTYVIAFITFSIKHKKHWVKSRNVPAVTNGGFWSPNSVYFTTFYFLWYWEEATRTAPSKRRKPDDLEMKEGTHHPCTQTHTNMSQESYLHGCRFSSVVERLPSMHKVMCSIPRVWTVWKSNVWTG